MKIIKKSSELFDKSNRIHDDLISELKKPRHRAAARQFINDYLLQHQLSATSVNKVRKQVMDPNVLKPVDLKWSATAKDFRHVISTSKDPHPAEIAMAFFDRGYICFGTALYWNDLSNQTPTNYYIANERKTPSRIKSSLVVDDLFLQDQFIKPVRESSRYATWGEFRFTLIDRDASNFSGVITKTITASARKIQFSLTDKERTLLDCAVSPQRAGGIQAVVESFRAAAHSLSLDKLITYYDSSRFKYPYWQRVGLLLEKSSNSKFASHWSKHFGKSKFRFYVDHNYSANWVVDPTWSVAYPKGLF